MIELYRTFSLNRAMIQDKKAKKEMPLLGWSIAEPQDTDKVQDVSLTLKVNISSNYILVNTLYLKSCVHSVRPLECIEFYPNPFCLYTFDYMDLSSPLMKMIISSHEKLCRD